MIWDVVKKNHAALEGVKLILSAAMPEDTASAGYTRHGVNIRISAFLDEDGVVKAFIHELTELTIAELLVSLGLNFDEMTKTYIHFCNLEGHIPHILTQLSLST